MAKKNLAKIAKGIQQPKKKTTTKKLTPKEKAKALADELVKEAEDLIDFDITKTKEKTKENKESIEWLQEQVSILTEANETLTKEAVQAKNDYKKIFEEHQKIKNNPAAANQGIQQKVVKLFVELQNNLLGINKERTKWEMAKIRVVLTQMVQLFPFLQQIKKF